METLSSLSLMERMVFLRRVALFQDLSPDDLKHVAEISAEHAFSDGAVIAEEGEPGTSCIWWCPARSGYWLAATEGPRSRWRSGDRASTWARWPSSAAPPGLPRSRLEVTCERSPSTGDGSSGSSASAPRQAWR